MRYVFTYSGDTVVYRSKRQSLTALSSIEAEFIAAVTAAKTAKYIRSALCKLGFKQTNPTPIYKDDKPTTKPIKTLLNLRIQQSKPGTSTFISLQYKIGYTNQKTFCCHTHLELLNPLDNLTKALGRVLHKHHSRYVMGRYNTV